MDSEEPNIEMNNDNGWFGSISVRRNILLYY